MSKKGRDKTDDKVIKDFLYDLWNNNDYGVLNVSIFGKEEKDVYLPIGFEPCTEGVKLRGVVPKNVAIIIGRSDIAECSCCFTKVNNAARERLYKLALKKLIESYGIRSDGDSVPYEKLKNKFYQDDLPEEISNLVGSLEKITGNLVFVKGEEKQGKSTVLNAFLAKLTDYVVYRLDFNFGNTDIVDFLYYISSVKNTNKGKIYILLENLYCCEMDQAEKIVRFFTELADTLVNHSINMHIAVSELPNKTFLQSKKSNTVVIESNCAAKSVLGHWTSNFTSPDILIASNICEYKDYLSFGKLLLNILLNIKEKSDVDENAAWHRAVLQPPLRNFGLLDEEETALFYKILIFATYEMDILIDNEYESAVFKRLYKKIDGLKAYRSLYSRDKYCVSFYKTDTAKLILNYLNNVFANDSLINEAKDFCKNYLRSNHSLGQLRGFVKTYNNFLINESETTETDIDREFTGNYIMLTKRSLEFKDRLVKNILDSNGDSVMGGHLGRLMFALETIVKAKSDSWDDNRAINKLKNHVRKAYFIDGPSLPEVNTKYVNIEKTKLDFIANGDEDCIRNQVELQDVLLRKYTFSEEEACSSPGETESYAYFLTEIQRKEREIDDYERFYRTYILALLFEIEKTLSYVEDNSDRLRLLLNKIYGSVIDDTIEYDNNSEIKTCYCYPARVPWVTARMCLAITNSDERLNLSTEEAEKLNACKEKMQEWLKSVSHKIKLPSGQCRIWCGGTGGWNSVLDTTILCASAIGYSTRKEFNLILKEAKEYVELRKSDWLTKGNATSGIWAQDVISHVGDFRSINNAIKEMQDILMDDNALENPVDDKADKAMGYTSIANNLVSFCNKINANVYSWISEVISGTIHPKYDRIKVFISYKTSNRQLLAENIQRYCQSWQKDAISAYLSTLSQRSGGWLAQLENNIKCSNKILLLMSNDIFASEAVQDEMRFAKKYNKESDIIPIYVDCNLDKKAAYRNIDFSTIPDDLNFLKRVCDPNITNCIVFSQQSMESIRNGQGEKLIQFIVK